MRPEAARAMALIRKSGRKRNFRNVCVQQWLHGAFDPPQTTRKAGKLVPLAAESFAKLERQH
jgi:hypothetical protein